MSMPAKQIAHRMKIVKKTVLVSSGGLESKRGEENPSLKIMAKLAGTLQVELRDLFEFAQASSSALMKKLNGLLKNADQATLQQAVKLLRALLV
jgi:DNA-binding XRE family transcriptional regulator